MEGATLVSAPGKVLLTGAYLILERPNAGLVLSTSARFYALLKPLKEGGTDGQQAGEVDITVVSPQLGRRTRYRLCQESLDLQPLLEDGSQRGRNPFVEAAMQLGIAAAQLRRGRTEVAGCLRQGLELTIAGDNDFYSHRQGLSAKNLPLCSASLAGLPPFSPAVINSPKEQSSDTPEIAKTGLGSSAAMTTAIIGAVLHHLGIVQIPNGTSKGASSENCPEETARSYRLEQESSNGTISEPAEGSLQQGMQRGSRSSEAGYSILPNPISGGLRSHQDDADSAQGRGGAGKVLSGEAGLGVVHALAQAAHCAAQGKVGSGFDVSAAVYGSQRYMRFSPQVLKCLTAGAGGAPLPARQLVSEVLAADWDCQRENYALPPGLILMVGEPGNGGSSTPSMVGSVQKWRKEQPQEASLLWSNLSTANCDVEQGLRTLKQLAKEHEQSYRQTLGACSKLPSSQWHIVAGSGSQVADTTAGQIVDAMLTTRKAFGCVRQLLKEMGDRAGVPIEPEQQTQSLDKSMSLPGVLFAGVPGAGGYDAAFAVVMSEEVRQSVDSSWSKLDTLALCTEEHSGGIRLEVPEEHKIVT